MTAYRDRMDGARGGIAVDLLKGAVAGAIAVWALDRVDWFMWGREDPGTQARTRAVRPGGLDPAHVLASKAAEAMGRELAPLSPEMQHPAGLATHYAIGIGPGAAYAALRDRVPALTAGGGTLFGLGLFLAQDEALNALTGLAAPPQDYPWQDHARGLVAHMVYGAVLEATLRALDGPPGERRQLAA